jgi:anti-sigma B factor antagonist
MDASRVFLDLGTVADGRVVVHLVGELDVAEADAVRRILMAEAQISTVVAVDLAELSFIDLSGVRALHAAQRAASECGSTLVFVSPPPRLTKLVRLMELGPMPFSEDRSVLEEPRSRMDGRPRSLGTRKRARRVRADGAPAWRASSRRTPGPGGPSCFPDDPS